MDKRFFRKANSLVLAAALAATLAPAPMVSAAGAEGTAVSAILRQAESRAASVLDKAAIEGKEYTVIKGNAPVLPKSVASEGAPAEIQWAAWDKNLEAGKYTLTGTAGGTQITVTVNVLPCDEAVQDVNAMGRKLDDGGTETESRDAIHPLKGYKGLFVTEYDLVPSSKSTHDRAVIYLPEAMNDGSSIHAENCWDTGARLQFKHGYGTSYYFQTQIGDGQVVGNARYYPTDQEIDDALASGQAAGALAFDEVSTYRVRTVMDTATDPVKGNYKIYITDPEGIEHEVTQPGGNGFRIYPKNGIVKNFAAVRGSFQLKNHKVSWISGYATKKVETYLKAQGADAYAKEGEAEEKVLPGAVTERPAAEMEKDGQQYVLDAEKSGWYNGEDKVASVTAEEGKTVTYRAYYEAVKAVEKAALDAKIQAAEAIAEDGYTAGSWKAFQDVLANARQVQADAEASQEEVDEAAQALDTAIGDLVSIKELKAAFENRKAELARKEGQKDSYRNWDEVQRAVDAAGQLLQDADATQAEVDTMVEKLRVALVAKPKVKVKSVKAAAKSYQIAVGKKLDVKKIFTVLPGNAANKKLSYSIDKKYSKYASLKSGVVTTKKKGAGKTIAVKAKAMDGSGKSASIKIKIMKHAVTKITVKKKSLTVKAGRKATIKPVVTANGKSANKKLSYTSSNEKLATVKNGVVSAKKGKKGTVTITIRSTDGTNKSVKVKVKIIK